MKGSSLRRLGIGAQGQCSQRVVSRTRWSVQSVATYSRITGDGADSPIVEDLGAPDQFSLSLSARYTLGQ